MKRLLIILALLWVQPALGEEVRRYAYSFHWENDLFGLKGTDRWYTNGLRYAFTNDTRHDLDLPEDRRYKHPLNGLTDWFCGAGCSGRGWAVGHQFYTPSEIEIAELQRNDRPWAGWAYYGIHAQRGSDEEATTFEVDIGVVGPIAQSKFIQTKWHEILGDSDEPLGWDNQIKNEPAFVMTWQHRLKRGGTAADIVYHYGGHLGTVQTAGFVGATVRVGRNISGVGIPSIRPSVHVPLVSQSSTAPQFVDENVAAISKSRSEWWRLREWYVFAYGEVRAVAYNIFLDGNVFRNSPHTVDKKDVVPEVGWGITWRWNNNRRISYIRSWRGEEFEASNFRGPKVQTFGALVFSTDLD